jgi:hypothetical protein
MFRVGRYVRIYARPIATAVAIAMTFSLCCSLVLGGQSGTTHSANSLEHFQAGERLFAGSNYQGAGLEFIAALKGDLQPRWTLVWSRVELGKVWDVVGLRDRAVLEYRLALKTNDNTRGALDEANRYLRVPFKRD